jgi:probable phosphoglycerate mutase
VTTLLLVRHALCDPVGRSIAGRSPGVLLNAIGRAQAERLTERLAAAPIEALYSSPLERARETARPIAERLGLEIRVAPGLMELDYGDWTGLTLDQVRASTAWKEFNSFRSCARIPGGELMLEVQARAVAELERLREHHAGWVIAVSHGDVIRAAIAHYAGIPLDLMQRLEIGPASVSALSFDAGGVRILRLNDTGEPLGA